MPARMVELARQQPGYLGHDVRRATERAASPCPTGPTHAAAAAWKQVAEHLVAQQRGREAWYADYTVRIATRRARLRR